MAIADGAVLPPRTAALVQRAGQIVTLVASAIPVSHDRVAQDRVQLMESLVRGAPPMSRTISRLRARVRFQKTGLSEQQYLLVERLTASPSSPRRAFRSSLRILGGWTATPARTGPPPRAQSARCGWSPRSRHPRAPESLTRDRRSSANGRSRRIR